MIAEPGKIYDFIQGETLLFDKPYGWTSFDLVGKIRNILCRKLKIKKLKVGHAGTLDPLATGLMIVCTGRNTKHVERLQMFEKEYHATLKTGATTPSFDLETPEDASFKTEHITRELLDETFLSFRGTINQVPPLFSAVKIEGKRAYKHARLGNEPELQPRMVVIREIELLSEALPEIEIRVVCSKGTYIRALARDIGAALGSGAYLTALRRTRIGDFSIDNAFKVEEFEELIELLDRKRPF
jgi:tRNA pseudouridine55 synthase